MILSPIWACFLVQGKQFVNLWAGQINNEAYYVAILLMTAQLFIMTEAMGTQILWARNEHKEQAYLKFCVVIINIALTILLIKWKPLIGATIGTLISLFLGDIVVMNVIFQRKIGFDVLNYYRMLLSGVWCCIALTILSGTVLNWLITTSDWGVFFIKIIFMVTIYFITLYLFGMNDRERKMINIFASKVVGRRK